jgi:hypothetical protein
MFIQSKRCKFDNNSFNQLCKITFSFPLGFHILEENENRINWASLSSNTSYDALDLLEKNLDKIDWTYLHTNPSSWASEIFEGIFEENPSKIMWNLLSQNISPRVIVLIEKKIEEENNLSEEELQNMSIKKKICWNSLSQNPSAIKLLEKNINKVNWYFLSKNSAAVHLLKDNIDKINISLLCKNPNIGALNLLEQIIKTDGYRIIKWDSLYENPNALYFIRKNFNDSNAYLIELPSFSLSSLFFDEKKSNKYQYIVEYLEEKNSFPLKLNKDYLKERMNIIKEELCAKVFHPKNEGKLWFIDED